MRDILAKMRECGKDVKMRDFRHDSGVARGGGMAPHAPPPKLLVNVFFLQLIYVVTFF